MCVSHSDSPDLRAVFSTNEYFCSSVSSQAVRLSTVSRFAEKKAALTVRVIVFLCFLCV